MTRYFFLSYQGIGCNSATYIVKEISPDEAQRLKWTVSCGDRVLEFKWAFKCLKRAIQSSKGHYRAHYISDSDRSQRIASLRSQLRGVQDLTGRISDRKVVAEVTTWF
jgi:hypothetical protein